MKRTHLGLIAVLCVGTIRGAEVQFPIAVDQLKTMTVEERRFVFASKLSNKLRDRNETFAYFAAGLADTDDSVRKSAATTAMGAIVALQKITREGKPLPFDTSQIGVLQDALIGAAFDSNPEVRGAALEAIIYSDQPSEWIETLATEAYKYEANAQIRGQILKSLAFAGYRTDAVGGLLVSGLSDPDHRVREEAARALGVFPVEAALSRLMELLENDKEMVLDPILLAVAAFGPQAKPYLSKIEALLAQNRFPGSSKDRAELAIAVIHEAIELPAQPKIESVRLGDSAFRSLPDHRNRGVSKSTKSGPKRIVEPESESAGPLAVPLTWILGLAGAVIVGIWLVYRRKLW